METVSKNKVFLINTLSTDANIILQHVENDNIITRRDYNNLHQAMHTQEEIIINLLDNVMDKGDGTCLKFLKLLEKEDLQEIFPQLKNRFTTEPRASARERGPHMAHRANQGAEFVDKHRKELVQRISSVMEIADCLLSKEMITKEMYSTLGATVTRQDKMRKLYECLDLGGQAVKEEFYEILKEKFQYLVKELQS